jgi:hypothetical protein
MTTDLEYIEGFSPLFAHFHKKSQYKFRSPLGATAYYILLIKNFPTNFTAILDDAKKVMGSNINSNKLKIGRSDLLEQGVIAQVLPVNQMEKGREMFIPISPQYVWKDNVESLNEIISPEGILQRSKFAKELQYIYDTNFGNYGVGREYNSITIFHSSQWLLNYLLYNINDNKNLRLLLGTLGTFREPNIIYYKKLLEAGLNIKIICDPISEKSRKFLDNILNLKEIYQNLEITATSISYGTSRRVIYDNMAIDSRKLVDAKSDLSYISTIYFDAPIIERFRLNFDAAFYRNKSLDK